MRKRRVRDYADAGQTREKLALETYQYRMPFNYKNITVFRKYYRGTEFHGVELEPVNPQSPMFKVEECKRNEWFKAGTTFVVPPSAAKARFQIEVARQRPGETLLIDDVFSTVVPDGWRKTDPLPGGAKNQLKNAGFEEIDKKSGFAGSWHTATLGKGTISVTEGNARKGRRAILVKSVSGIALWQDINVSGGQSLFWSGWLRSSKPDPRVIYIFPKFFDSHGGEVSDRAGDCIVIRENKPIVRVAVIGSACTPPGYVQIECEELESWRRRDELRTIMPVRFRANNLWGMHLRADQWIARGKGPIQSYDGHAYEEIPEELGLANCVVKSDCVEFPFAGMSSAIFEIPPSRKVIIRGGSETAGWLSDSSPGDGHYSFRIIRTTVIKSAAKGAR